MFHSRTGLPEEGELVLCTVTKIQYSSVFVNIDEYNTSGMIHISEIAAGRIRNIRDYVKEGKKVVCKVLRVHRDRGHVDLSLRRVTDSQRRNKVNEIKLEQKAESIVQYVAKQNKINPKILYDKLMKSANLDYLHTAFENLIEGKFDMNTFGLDNKLTKQIEDVVRQRFKPKSVEISGVLSLATYDSNGVEVIRKALSDTVSGSTDIRYLGGGKYKVSVKAKDYKAAEPRLKKAVDSAIQYVEKHNGIGGFKRS